MGSRGAPLGECTLLVSPLGNWEQLRTYVCTYYTELPIGTRGVLELRLGSLLRSKERTQHATLLVLVVKSVRSKECTQVCTSICVLFDRRNIVWNYLGICSRTNWSFCQLARYVRTYAVQNETWLASPVNVQQTAHPIPS